MNTNDTNTFQPKFILSDRKVRLFIFLGGFFIANALVAELIGVKIFALEPTLGKDPWDFELFGQKGALQFSAGVLLWPVVFIMTDIINEYYGKRGVRMLSFLTVGLIGFAFVAIFGSIQLAPADWWQSQNVSKGVPSMQTAFEVIFGQGMLIIIGSITAFLAAQLVDVSVFHWLKKYTGEKSIWVRATGSTVISQLFDSFVVLAIAFKWGPELTGASNPMTWSLLFSVATVQYIYKFTMAVVLTPVLYLAHHWIDRYLGDDAAKHLKQEAAIWK